MKVAFWGLGIVIIGLLGLVLVNLFGNISVTNQLNYTTMKNDVEASMYDALDETYYRAGFCLCTEKSKTNGKWVFNDDSEYELLDITYEDNGDETCKPSNSVMQCEVLKGEYRLNKKAFVEGLVRRLAEVVNNNKDYEIIIQDIIEYPPKVSVRINSKDTEFTPTEKNSGGYTIVNQMDALIETKNGLQGPLSDMEPEVTPEPTVEPTATPEPTPTAEPFVPACYLRQNDQGAYVYEWYTSDPGGTEYMRTDKSEQDCKNVCYCDKNDNCGLGANDDELAKLWYSFDAKWERVVNPKTNEYIRKSSECGYKCYYTSSDLKYTWAFILERPENSQKTSRSKTACKNVCYCRNQSECQMRANLSENNELYKKWTTTDKWTVMKDSNNYKITDSSKCNYACYYGTKSEQYTWAFAINKPADSVKENVSKGNCKNVCYCNSDYSKCGLYAQGKTWSGWTEFRSITDSATCKAKIKSSSPSIPDCKWHYNGSSITCKSKNSSATKSTSITNSSAGAYNSGQDAYDVCASNANAKCQILGNYEYYSGCLGERTYSYRDRAANSNESWSDIKYAYETWTYTRRTYFSYLSSRQYTEVKCLG